MSTTRDAGNIKGKDQLRAHYEQARKDLSASARAASDALIAERVCDLEAYRGATTVLAYLSCGSEVDTHAIIERAWADGKIVAVPRCATGTAKDPAEDTATDSAAGLQTGTPVLTWHRIASLDELAPGAFGVDEPPGDDTSRIDIEALDENAIALVPGVAFDVDGNRCGHGSGYFDVFLARFSGISIGLCRDVQICPSLEDAAALDAHDQPVDIVVTEARTIARPLK